MARPVEDRHALAFAQLQSHAGDCPNCRGMVDEVGNILDLGFACGIGYDYAKKLEKAERELLADMARAR